MTLYVTDLDGTLLRSDASLSEFSAKTLNSLLDRGVTFTYATARSFASASPLVKELRLSCPAATFNGVFIVDPRTGERIIENVFSEECRALAEDFFEREKIAPLVYSSIDGRERVSFLESRFDEVARYVRMRKGDRRLRPVSGYKELFAGESFYFTVIDPVKLGEMNSFFTAENGFSKNVQRDTYEDMIWYEICDINASKANAALQIKKLIRADSLTCFGDNLNDMSMILAADTGCAVENACDELKANAGIVIQGCDCDGVAKFIDSREKYAGENRFSAALAAATIREKGVHGSVGTQNEKLIHSVLKNYYVPFSDEQEIRIGSYFADAVCADGIFEIQTKALYRLKDKLKAFTEFSRTTVVHPVVCECKTLYINAESGEIVKESAPRKSNSAVKVFEELYSVKSFLRDENFRIILARLKIEKRVYFYGSELPNMRSKNARKRCVIEKIPLELVGETVLDIPRDYEIFLPEELPEQFTKKQLSAAAKESASSLRTEILREVGLIEIAGKKGGAYLYVKKQL